ncbi:uncharacterized protein Pyn_19588 [Prunus yedoensis var. nudiflora]|uniref:DUF4378 domain-containing protein n=1 Tax=Prunus yedoensis var. nudiflora TaxID=2094558 RepID=A0A314ZAZ5_PRUYE|nr:uncharacterized protein Pyn_19588 [Prunus yedoensis var. nudiflora]
MGSRKSITTQQKPVLLKDYLMDDLSSCSSNGFKSFPRRHCCTTTVRFLLDMDLKSSCQPSIRKINQQTPKLNRSRSRASAACDAVINAVKILPFHSVKHPSPSVRKGVLLLPRSLSRRLRRKSFWRKQSKEEKQAEKKDNGRLRLFREFLQEKSAPSDQTTATTAITGSRLSTSTRSSESKTDSHSNSNCNSWGESEFTLGSESSSGNDVMQGERTSSVKNKVSERVGEDSVSIDRPTTTTTTCSPQNAKEWLNIKEEKEQFSPVSVLDCPFEDEDDQTSSPFSCSLARMQGTQQKLMQKIRRFEGLAQLEPVDLEKRMDEIMSDSEVEDEAPTSPLVGAKHNHGAQIVNSTQEKAGELVQLIKSSSAPSNKLVTLKVEELVLDLCRDRMVENSDENVVMKEVMKLAEDWINGQSQELLLGWEVENGRKVYVNDMDKYCGNWRELEEEKQEVGLELEVEVWNSLMKELLLDILI